MMKAPATLVSLVSLALLTACSSSSDGDARSSSGSGPEPGFTTGTGGDSTTSTGTASSGAGGSAGATGTTGGAGSFIGTGSMGDSGLTDPDKCGEHHFDLERKPAELLLLLDRSASMLDDVNGKENAKPSKWDLVVPAVNEVITSTDAAVSWGMKVFPEGTGSSCVATGVTSNIDVPVAAMNASRVTSAVTMTTAEGNGTPTGDAVTQAMKYLQSIKDDNPKYILLATDGEPSCPVSQEKARPYAKQAVATAAAAGIHTFVVGVATTKDTAMAALNDMAVAGLEARDDPNPLATKYYLASTKDELVRSLKVITGQVSGCLFTWTDVPPVPDNIAVKVGGAKAPHDVADGWEYVGTDHKGVEVRGSWCEKSRPARPTWSRSFMGAPVSRSTEHRPSSLGEPSTPISSAIFLPGIDSPNSAHRGAAVGW